MLYVDYSNIARDIIVNVVSLYFYAYMLMLKRHKNTELFITCALFNIALLLVVMTIVRTDFNWLWGLVCLHFYP